VKHTTGDDMPEMHNIKLTNRQLQIIEGILVQHILLAVYDVSHEGNTSKAELVELEEIADIFTTEVEAQFASDIAKRELTDEKLAHFLEQSKRLDD
jgi:hypothetical protein